MIYCVQAEHGGPVKIGYSTNEGTARRRLATLQTGSPFLLVMRDLIPGSQSRMSGREACEALLHLRFADYKLVGEWFLPVPEMLELFPNMMTGTYEDVSLSTVIEGHRADGYQEGWEAAMLVAADRAYELARDLTHGVVNPYAAQE